MVEVQTSSPGPSLRLSMCPGARVPPSSQYSLGPLEPLELLGRLEPLEGLAGQRTVLHCRVSLPPPLPPPLVLV